MGAACRYFGDIIMRDDRAAFQPSTRLALAFESEIIFVQGVVVFQVNVERDIVAKESVFCAKTFHAQTDEVAISM